MIFILFKLKKFNINYWSILIVSLLPLPWMFQNYIGGYFVDNQVYGRTSRTDRILSQKEMLGRWNDILINANWTDAKNSLSSSITQKLFDGFKVYNYYMNFNIIKSFYYLICLGLNYLKKK